MIAPATKATTANSVNWSLTRRCKRMLGPMVGVVGGDQRVAGGVGAGHHTDGASPLHLEFGQLALEPGPGQETGVKPAQGQVGDGGEIGVVPAHPSGALLCYPGEGCQEAQCPCQCGASVG